MAFTANRPSHKSAWSWDFPTVGQGVIIFNIERHSPFAIYVSPKVDQGKPGHDEWISLCIHGDSAAFRIKRNNQVKELNSVSNASLADRKGYKQDVGYVPGQKVAYWLSYNRDLLQLRYGKGYVMEESTVMSYDFLQNSTDQEATREEYEYLFSPYIRRRIELYDIYHRTKLIDDYAKMIIATGRFQRLTLSAPTAADAGVDKAAAEKQEAKKHAIKLLDVEGNVQLMPNPFVVNRSPFILDSSKITLDLLDSNRYTFSASLPAECLELYQNVINCELDSPSDKYPLSDAMQHSIDTPGCELFNKLNEKNEFGEDKSLGYLRITCGPHRGKSAGIPYVLEVWPQGHGSPIHNHGNSFAVISVLHGDLEISIYNKHTTTNDETPVKTIQVQAGDATWLTPNWFQTHKVQNISKNTFCATIQCYQYSNADLNQYPYFDYVTNEDTIDEFLPNSDYTFHEMKKLVMDEYNEFMDRSSSAAECPTSRVSLDETVTIHGNVITIRGSIHGTCISLSSEDFLESS